MKAGIKSDAWPNKTCLEMQKQEVFFVIKQQFLTTNTSILAIFKVHHRPLQKAREAERCYGSTWVD